MMNFQNINNINFLEKNIEDRELMYMIKTNNGKLI